MFSCNNEGIAFGMNIHTHTFTDMRMRLMAHHLFIHLSKIFGRTTVIYALC